MTLLLEDILIAARTVYGEARGEPYLGLKAVAHVIINRSQAQAGDKDSTLAGTALRHLQFSCWNEGDPNREVISRVDFMDGKFRAAMKAVLEAIDEADFTLNARWYHVASIMPGWAKGHVPCFSCGSHVFYNDID